MTGKERLINEMEMVRRLIDVPNVVRSITKEQRTRENSERGKRTWGPSSEWVPWHTWKTKQLKDEIKKEYEGRINNDISIFDQYFES